MLLLLRQQGLLWRRLAFLGCDDLQVLPFHLDRLIGGWRLDDLGDDVVQRLVLHVLVPGEVVVGGALPLWAEALDEGQDLTALPGALVELFGAARLHEHVADDGLLHVLELRRRGLAVGPRGCLLRRSFCHVAVLCPLFVFHYS